MNKNIFFSKLILLILLGQNISAENHFISQQKKYILELYKNRRYFDAITETGRLINYSKKSKPDYSYFINLNYFAGNQYKTVIMNLDKKNNLQFKKKLLTAQAFFKLGDPVTALKIINTIRKKNLNHEQEQELIIRRIELELYIQNYEKAPLICRQYLHKFPKDTAILKLNSELEKHPAPERKSVPLATGLSVLFPGAGQFYSGKYWQAITTFLIISAASYASYYLYRHNEKSLSYTCGFFAVLFYSGNIYGAYNSATEYNERAWQNYYNKVTAGYIRPYQPEKYLDKSLFK